MPSSIPLLNPIPTANVVGANLIRVYVPGLGDDYAISLTQLSSYIGGGGGGGGSGTVASSTIGQLAIYTGATTVTGLAFVTAAGSTLSVAGTVAATTLTGDGSGITGLNATSITSGTIPNARTTGAIAATPSTLVLRDGSGNGDFLGLTLNSVAYAFPGTHGTNGQVLTSDGTGNVTWSTLSGAISGLTTGTIPVAASSTTIADSILTISGSVVTLTGTLVVTGTTVTINGVAMVFPAGHGTSGQALTDNGSGTLSWASVAANDLSHNFGTVGSGTITHNYATYPNSEVTLSGNITFAVNNPAAAGTATQITTRVIGDGTHNVTWPATYNFGTVGAPPIPGNGASQLVTAYSDDGGVSYIATWGGLDANLLVTGTLPNGVFPATLPAASGVNLTALNGSNIASGTVANARTTGTAAATASTLALRDGSGNTAFVGLTLNGVAYTFPGADGTSGYVLSTNGSGVLSWVVQSGGGGSGTVASSTTGQIAAYTGATTVTGLSYITTSGTTLTVAGTVAATTLTGAGSGITALSGTNISSGTVADARLPATMAGKTLNAASYQKTAPTISGGTLALDYNNGPWYVVSLNADIATLTVSNWPASGTSGKIHIVFVANGTAHTVVNSIGGVTLRWDAHTAPTLPSTNDHEQIWTLQSDDGLATKIRAFVSATEQY